MVLVCAVRVKLNNAQKASSGVLTVLGGNPALPLLGTRIP